MAFTSIGTLGNNGSTSNNQANLTVATSAALAVGDFAVFIVAVDANATTDGDDNAVASVSHAGTGQDWLKGVQFANGQGTLGTGCSVSIWYRKLTAAIASGQGIVITFTSSTNSDESAASAWKFTMDTTKNIKVEGTATLANDGAAAGSMNVTTANVECLRIRATASESATATAWTPTGSPGGWLLMTLRGSGGTTDAAQHIRGEFHISTGTGDASTPTGGAGAVDNASAYIAFSEAVPPPNTDNMFLVM
jgi:hypothetical protein